MDFDWIFDWDMGPGPRRGRGRHRRGPGRRFFRQGEVRLALLSLLGDEPAHGYELMKRLEERSGGMYRASAGTVYPVLQQLEDEGLVRIEEEDGKKVYHLTEAGREELLVHEDDTERIWRRAHGWKDPRVEGLGSQHGTGDRRDLGKLGAAHEGRVPRRRQVRLRGHREGARNPRWSPKGAGVAVEVSSSPSGTPVQVEEEDVGVAAAHV